MAHQPFLVGLVLVPALLLVVLVWWRFYGKGREALKSAAALRRYQCIQNRYYDVSDFIDPIPPVEPSPGEGIQDILQDLLGETVPTPEDGWAEPGEGECPFPEGWGEDNPQSSSDQKEPGRDPVPATGSCQETPLPPPATAPGSPDTPDEGDDAIAPSLFYNAVTAPAPTENDSRNRQAVAAHRARRGDALRAKLTKQREALGELFLGNPAAAKPEDQAS